jgi:Secretion system C-terminal sorting domain
MKNIKIVFLSFVIVFSTITTKAQNADPTIAVTPSNAGIVAVGATIDIVVTVGNALAGNIAPGRMRPTCQIPSSVIYPASQPGLPTGWTILSNSNGIIRLCNSSANLAGFSTVDIVLKVQGVTVAAPNTISANQAGGNACANGPFVTGNNTANDGATTTIEVIAATLPLTLLNFNATLVKCVPSLTWVTENELNTDRFEIERGSASGSNFTTVGTVAANGNSSSQIRYNFLDSKTDALSEKVFYRLKMIDKDGLHKYSDIAIVVLNCNTPKVSIYPNPIQDDKIFINLAGTVGRAQATLSSITGQLIARNNMVNGSNSINVSNIADGIYILKVKDENGFDSNNKIVIKH